MFWKNLAVYCVLAVAISGSAHAGELGYHGAGGQLGFTSTGGGSTISFGAHVDLGEIYPNVEFRPSVTYWSKSYGYVYGDWSLTELRINSDFRYMFDLERKFTPYAGAGLAFARYSISSDRYDDYSYGWGASSGIELNIIGGAEMPISSGLTGFGELRFENSSTNFQVGVTLGS